MEVCIEGITHQIDDYDVKIINILLDDGRISFSDLANQVGLSRPIVTARINKLQQIGLIEKFTINTYYTYSRKNLSVYLDIQVVPSEIANVAKKISSFKEIAVVYQMTGGSLLHTHGFFSDINEVSTFLNENIYPLKGVENIRCEFILKKYKSDFV